MKSFLTIPSIPFLVKAFAIVINFFALIVIVGWLTQSLQLSQITAASIFIPYNSALLFLMCGINLLLLDRVDAKVSRIIGLIVLTVSLIIGSQYFLNTNYGVDTLFIKTFISAAPGYPGRMTPNSVTSFILLGIVF